MIEGIFGAISQAIGDAVIQARRRQAELAAEQERARAQFASATQKGPDSVSSAVQPTRGAVARRKQSQAAQAPARPVALAPDPSGLGLFAERGDFARGVIMAEVLGPPVALRDPSTFPPGATF